MQEPQYSAVKLEEKLALFDDHWPPRIVGLMNEHEIMGVKAKGAFSWHHHDEADDFFLVLSGVLRIETEHGTVTLHPGEFFIIPRGVRHRPVAEEEVSLMLIEPAGTPNTGNAATAAKKV